jgi:hypothetical protein
MPDQWLKQAIRRKRLSANLESYVAIKRNNEDVPIEKDFIWWERLMSRHSQGSVKRIADTEVLKSVDSQLQEAHDASLAA